MIHVGGERRGGGQVKMPGGASVKEWAVILKTQIVYKLLQLELSKKEPQGEHLR